MKSAKTIAYEIFDQLYAMLDAESNLEVKNYLEAAVDRVQQEAFAEGLSHNPKTKGVTNGN